MDQQTQTQGGATTGVSGGAEVQPQQTGAPAGGTGSSWDADEKFRGKGPDDVYRSYKELEKKLGGLPQMEEKLKKWESFGSAWDPILRQWDPIMRQHGYDPQRVAQALEAASQRAAQQGNPQAAAQLGQQAQQAQRWADMIHPHEQEQWLDQFVTGKVTPLQQQFQQAMQQVVQEGASYINRYMDLALQAIEQKISNPKLDIRDLLQEAVNIASGRYNPIQWAAKIKTAPSEQDVRAQIEKELREQIETEHRNKSMTTFVGPQGSGKTPLKPLPRSNQEAPKSPAFNMAEAKSRFLKDYSKFASSPE